VKQGKYIVIEGHDGTGKSTQVGMIRKMLAEQGIESIEFHEPAGNPIADSIRTILKNGTLPRVPMTDVLLFTAARCDIWENLALPALSKGVWVVAARNYFSTLAYQGYGSGIDLSTIESITRMSTDERYMKPDYAFILDLDDKDERAKRISNRGKLQNPDTFESRTDDFQERVEQGYIDIAKSHNLPTISANQTVEKVSEDIWEHIVPNI
jgi:dTMP kinase